MMSRHPSNDQWPLPLVTKKGAVAEAVRAYAQNTGESGAEAANLSSVMARMEGRPRRVSPLAIGVAVGALATAAAFLLVVGRLRQVPATAQVMVGQPSAPPVAPSPPPPTEPAVAATSEQRSPAASALPSLRLSAQPVALPVGNTEILGQAQVTLSADAVASGSSRDGATELALQRGSIELHVLPQAPGQPLVVVAGHHRFTVVGTVFTVSRIGTRIELRVQEGSVAVSRGPRQLALVKAGGHWNADEAPPAPPAAGTGEDSILPSRPVAPPLEPGSELAKPPTLIQQPAQAKVAVVPAQTDCRQLAASHRPQEAVDCYQHQSMRNGLAGETAAYELGRLWRDTLGQPDRALAAFETQRSRFPAGALRREADLSVIELLPRLSRHAEALVETQRFLTAYPRDERKGEIYLLRGNIYREVFRDLAHAELEYASGAGTKGRASDESHFFHAVCLEALGKAEEARSAYQAYLRQRGGAHSAKARERLLKLAP